MKALGHYLERLMQRFGRRIIQTIIELGHISIFAGKFFYWAVRPPFRWKLLFEQLYFIGNQSIFIIAVASVFTGMVFAYEVYFGFQIISVDSLVGPCVAFALAKELAPALSGIIVAGRAGAAMAAQIGTMKVTEQVDALEVMGIDSIQYLAVPRIIASALALPLLSALFLLIGNLGAWWVSTRTLMIDESLYFSKLSEIVFVSNIFEGLIKAMVFGFVLAVIGTYFGFQTTKGAEGVGKATNLSVVWGMILVLILDYFLTSFLTAILSIGG
ncbi:MAG: ABC transporter permease [Bacteriovoracaceae bacterium]|nr:ABC transporter permease [Bacteriovoracaceae bacterium]